MGRNPFDTYFSGAHFLEDYAEGRSKREITKLLEMNPTTAKLILPDGNTKIVDVSELKVGDQLQVLNGDQVPIDGIILSGTTSIDESSINGESIPKEKSKGDEVLEVRLMEQVLLLWKSLRKTRILYSLKFYN